MKIENQAIENLKRTRDDSLKEERESLRRKILGSKKVHDMQAIETFLKREGYVEEIKE